MPRTTFTADLVAGDWTAWVGPGPEPGTRRRLLATRFANRERGRGLRKAMSFALWLYTTPEGSNMRRLAERELRGKVLGCADRAHGLTLAYAADGRPLAEVLDLLPDVVNETRRLFA